MIKKFECPYNAGVCVDGRNTGRYAGMTVCLNTFSMQVCDGKVVYNNGRGASCASSGKPIVFPEYTDDNVELTKRQSIISSVDSKKPPTVDYTVARHFPAWISIESVPTTFKKLVHGLDGSVEWVR